MKKVKISIWFTFIFWMLMFIVTPNKFVNEFLNEYFLRKATDYFLIAISIFGIIQFILILSNDSLFKRDVFIYSGVASVIAFIFATLYYFTTKDLFTQGYNSKNEYIPLYFIIGTLPSTLITYQTFRLFFLKFFSREPRIVGKMEVFTEPLNWLFSILVLISGILLTALLFFIIRSL